MVKTKILSKKTVDKRNAHPELEKKLCAINGRFCFVNFRKRELKKEEARNHIYVSHEQKEN